MKLLLTLVLLAMTVAPVIQAADDIEKDGPDHINALVEKGLGSPVKLEGTQSITTRATFKPPVQITIVAKTDSTNLRIGYAASQVIFNWEVDPQQLRIDGGPANGQHKPGAGKVRTNKYVTIKWVVTASKQSIYVDDELRFEHSGDYSKIDNPVSVLSNKSTVTARRIRVKQL